MNTTPSQLRDPANWIVGFSVAVIAVNGYLFRGHELDDALIYARYIQNLISGNGFVYNAGEAVNGLTSPLFAYLSLVPGFLAGDARVGTLLVSVLAAIATVVIIYRLLSLFITDRKVAALATLFAAGNGMTFINFGMEASLFTFLAGLCCFLYFKDRFFLLGVCIGLAILTRPEAVFLVPAMALNTWFNQRQWPHWRCYIIPTAMVFGQLLFNLAYYGDPLPSSGLAKVSQGAMGHWGYNGFVYTLGDRFLHGFGLPFQLRAPGGLYVVPTLLMCIAAFALFHQRGRQYLLVSATFLLLYTGFFWLLNIPGQWWYYAIYFSVFSSWVVLGIDWLLACAGRLAGDFPRRLLRSGFLVVFALLLVWQQPIHMLVHGNTVREDYRQFGLWIAANTPPDAAIGVAEIGTVGWYSERRIIDILGLVTAGNSDFVGEGDYFSWLSLHPPDYILARDPPRFYERAVTILQREQADSLVEVEEFDFPDYKLYRYLPGELPSDGD